MIIDEKRKKHLDALWRHDSPGFEREFLEKMRRRVGHDFKDKVKGWSEWGKIGQGCKLEGNELICRST